MRYSFTVLMFSMTRLESIGSMASPCFRLIVVMKEVDSYVFPHYVCLLYMIWSVLHFAGVLNSCIINYLEAVSVYTVTCFLKVSESVL